MNDSIRCLAVRQPWAWAIIAGIKDIENRSWQTKYRGKIIIQASTTKTEVNRIKKQNKSLSPLDLHYGALIGVVDLVDIEPINEKLEGNPWAWGIYCWRLKNAKVFANPIPIKGRLNLYKLPSELEKPVNNEVANASPLIANKDDDHWVKAMITLYDDKTRYKDLLGAYFDLQDFQNALRISDNAIRRWGELDHKLDRVAALFFADNLDVALNEINKIIKKSSSNARAYYMRSVIHKKLKKKDLAKADYEKSVLLDPRYAD